MTISIVEKVQECEKSGIHFVHRTVEGAGCVLANEEKVKEHKDGASRV